jgi:transcription initiation factor TFIID TATA-box-binding protein
LKVIYASTTPDQLVTVEGNPRKCHPFVTKISPLALVLLFASGKLVCTGAKKEADIPKAVTKLQETLEEKGLITY